ncbi:MAG: hypothetical protein JWM85_3121, partial [Acidimicrobiaceae bacterium]|nr:hypothetical protein [Acidimicrobiaceae bacterium]
LPEDLDLIGALAKHFEITDAPSAPDEVRRALTSAGGLGLLTAGGNYLLVPRPELIAEAEADLDSSRLDVALSGLPAHEVVYQHGVRNAAAALAEGRAQAAFLLRPAKVAQIAETAHSGRRMPPKTTFFHPKPRTGFVFRSVEG